MQHSGERFLVPAQLPGGRGSGTLSEPRAQASGPRSASHVNSDPDAVAKKQKLVLEVLKSYGRVRIRAFGTSMLPAIWPGDVLGIERTGEGEIRDGDIALFQRRGHLFAHRVLVVRGSGEQLVLLAQGDSIPYADPPFLASELLGRVQVVVRAGNKIPLERRPGVFSHIASWLFRQPDPVRRISLAMHARYRRLAMRKTTSDARPNPASGRVTRNA